MKDITWSSEKFNFLNNILTHSIPLTFALINLLVLSDTIMYMQDIWAGILVLMGFAISNYIYSVYIINPNELKPVYGFLTWKDEDFLSSLGISLGTSFASISIEILCSIFSQVLRGRYEF